MISSSSGNLGLVHGLRATATTERLRSDHILTLELMQETADENVSLKEMNKKLLARLYALDGGNAQDNMDVTGAGAGAGINDKDDKDTAQIIQRVLKQDKEISDLKTENKLLKLRSSQDDKQLKEMQRKLTSYEAMRRELELFKEKGGSGSNDPDNDGKDKDASSRDSDESRLAQVKALQDECALLTETHRRHMATCSAAAANLEQMQLAHMTALDQQQKMFEADIAKLQESMQNLQSAHDTSCSELLTVRGQLETQVNKYKDLRRMADQGEQALQDRLHAARTENTSLSSQISDMQSCVDNFEKIKKQLEEQILTLQRELARYLTVAAAAGSLRNPLLLLPQVDADGLDAKTKNSGGGGGFFLTTDSDRDRDRSRASMESEPISESGGSSGGGAYFAEFVQLRRENKALKLQLLELAGGRRKSGSGSGGGGSGSSGLGRAH